MADLDFTATYLETWLRFIGVADIAVVRAAPTFGPPDAVEAAMAAACKEAAALAARF